MRKPYRAGDEAAPLPCPTKGVGSPCPVLVVNGYSMEWLSKGFPWVYPAEVVGRPAGIRAGQTVRVQGPGGRDLGMGIWDDGWLAVRVFRDEVGPIDSSFLKERLVSALSRRRGRLPPDTTAWRALNGENDSLPGLRVDVWGDWLTLLLDSPSLSGVGEGLADVLMETLAPRGIYQGWRTDPRETGFKGDPNVCSLIRGEEAPPDLEVSERGQRFRVLPGAGADAGLFPDMRDNRAALDPVWPGSRLLNLFAYTGAFSVFAAARGAREVLTVDLARTALDRAEANFRANGLDPANHVFLKEDAFHVLDRLRRKDEAFDCIVADPPSFARSPEGTFAIEKDLGRLIGACCRVLAPHGLLAVASNQGSMSPRAFQEAISLGARKAGRSLRIVHTGTQPVDYLAALDFPEGRYLKFWILTG